MDVTLQTVYFIIGIVGFVLAAVFLLAAILYFVRADIRSVQADLSGKTRQAGISEQGSRRRRNTAKNVLTQEAEWKGGIVQGTIAENSGSDALTEDPEKVGQEGGVRGEAVQAGRTPEGSNAVNAQARQAPNEVGSASGESVAASAGHDGASPDKPEASAQLDDWLGDDSITEAEFPQETRQGMRASGDDAEQDAKPGENAPVRARRTAAAITYHLVRFEMAASSESVIDGRSEEIKLSKNDSDNGQGGEQQDCASEQD